MILFPYYKETLVLPIEAKEVARKLKKQVLHDQDGPETSYLYDHSFVGNVAFSRFRIYRKVTAPNNFIPVITGQIESTSVGCLIFIRYRLFHSTSFFLLFWSAVSFGLGIYFLLFSKNHLYVIASFLMGTGNYLITIINFNRNLKMDKTKLQNVILS